MINFEFLNEKLISRGLSKSQATDVINTLTGIIDNKLIKIVDMLDGKMNDNPLYYTYIETTILYIIKQYYNDILEKYVISIISESGNAQNQNDNVKGKTIIDNFIIQDLKNIDTITTRYNVNIDEVVYDEYTQVQMIDGSVYIRKIINNK